MLSPIKSAALVLVAASSLVGCVGASQTAMIDEAGPIPLATGSDIAANPDMAAPASELLPAAVTQTLHTNGMFWGGVTALAANNGDLDQFDGGTGMIFGVAFGNENVKSFFELNYIETQGHLGYSETGAGGPLTWQKSADAAIRSLYAGLRRYLRPVTGQQGRVVPFVVAGLSYHTLDNYPPTGVTPAATADPALALGDAAGLGIYAGTGIELYLSSQITLGFDMRGSYWNWQGQPEATGENGTVASTVSVFYHF